MKVFDLHADIGFDVFNHQKDPNALENRHTSKLLQGDIRAVAMACFFDGSQSWQDMKAMITTLENALNRQQTWHRLLSKSDFDSNQPLALLSVEGMCGIRENETDAIEWMYEHGVRLASLCWNDENFLATGVKGNPLIGLSEAGKNVILKMEQLHMIIDVSHANEKTFWDIMNTSKGLVFATHSNAKTLCNHPRNLTDEQIKAIAKRKGLIGLNSCAYFVHEDIHKADVNELAHHAAYIRDLVGIDTLACGFDFMDFFEDDNRDYVLKGLENASQTQNFLTALQKEGFSDEDIQKICYQNVIEKMSGYLL